MEYSAFEGEFVREPVLPLVDLEALREGALKNLQPYSPDTVTAKVVIELTLRFPDTSLVRVIWYPWHDWHRWGVLVCPQPL